MVNPPPTSMETRHDDPRASGTLVAAAVGSLAVLVIVVALQALFYNTQESERTRKVTAVVPEELTRLRATQLEQLNQYRWVDAGHGVVTVPIERAMELTVRDQGRLPQATLPPPPAGGAGK